MKLFMKKYALPFGISVLSIIIFTIFRLIQQVSFVYQELYIWFGTIISILLIRSSDDFFDYGSDLKENKETLHKGLITTLFILFSIFPILLFTLSNKLLGLLLGMVYVAYVIVMIARSNQIGKMFIGFIISIISMFLISTLYDKYYYLNNIITIIYSGIISTVVLITSIVFGIIRGKKNETIYNNKNK